MSDKTSTCELCHKETSEDLSVTESTTHDGGFDVVNPYTNGKPIVAGNGIYMRCARCGKLVKMNKWLFGSMHVCS